MLHHFTVGMANHGKTEVVTVDAEDALIAALKVKSRHPEAAITYVRKRNSRGDLRNPHHEVGEARR